MKLSRDAKFLIAILIVTCVVIYLIGPKGSVDNDSTSSWSPGQHGTKAAYLGLGAAGFNVGRQTRPLRYIPRDARVLISARSPMRLDERDIAGLRKWVERGNTLILMDSAMESSLATEFDFMPDIGKVPPLMPKTVAPARTDYADGVKQVQVYPSVFVYPDPDALSIVKAGAGVVVSERRVGRGSVILVADEDMFLDTRIGQEDNFVLLTNLVHEHAGRGDGVLFAEWDRMLAVTAEKTGPLLGTAEKLVFGQLLLVLLVVILGSARRFGSIHPLRESSEQRRGVEFVQAMAGLYRRASAREAAVGAIYRSFRLEISLRFGASPKAGPSEVVSTILRARHVDEKAFMSLLDRCDRISAGKATISDGEAVELTRAIEGFRRELGIAV